MFHYNRDSTTCRVSRHAGDAAAMPLFQDDSEDDSDNPLTINLNKLSIYIILDSDRGKLSTFENMQDYAAYAVTADTDIDHYVR
jgi:hypothetical protein